MLSLTDKNSARANAQAERYLLRKTRSNHLDGVRRTHPTNLTVGPNLF